MYLTHILPEHRLAAQQALNRATELHESTRGENVGHENAPKVFCQRTRTKMLKFRTTQGTFTMPIHRASYELQVGPIPPSHDVIAIHPNCVAPTHLTLITRAERMRIAGSAKSNRSLTLTFLPAPPSSHAPSHRPQSRLYPASGEHFLDCPQCRATWRAA